MQTRAASPQGRPHIDPAASTSPPWLHRCLAGQMASAAYAPPGHVPPGPLMRAERPQLVAHDLEVVRGLDAQLYPALADAEHLHEDAPVDPEPFLELAIENQHPCLLPSPLPPPGGFA